MPVDPELLPGEPLEDAGELTRYARPLRQRPDDQEEEDQDREHGHADDAGAVGALERERAQDRVEELGSRDDREAERDRQQDDHVDVSERAAAHDRERGDRAGDGEAHDPDRRQLGREQIRLQDQRFHGARE
jgi:hypothetical protein